MPKPSYPRDTQYFLRRMREEKPDIYADYLAGKFESDRQAIIAAGFKKEKAEKTTLQVLVDAWNNASPKERLLLWRTLKSKFDAAVATRSALKPEPAINADRTLSEQGKTELDEIYNRRGITNRHMMREIGRSPLDASVQMARHRGTKIAADLVPLIEEWIKNNRKK